MIRFESFYWVIDEWLMVNLSSKRWDVRNSRRRSRKGCCSMSLVGLEGLHEQGIVRRELSPATILIRSSDGRAILTEFELAKLIDSGPTVSTDEWPVDPYRAGEADGDDVDVRSDIYSWARIGIHALLGELPEVGQEEPVLAQVPLPTSVHECLLKSASVFRSDRPSSIGEVISVIEAWD